MLARRGIPAHELEEAYAATLPAPARTVIYPALAVPDPARDLSGYRAARWWSPHRRLSPTWERELTRTGRLVPWPYR